MKKKVCLAFCCVLLTTGAVFAQEDAATESAAAQTDPRAAMAAMMAAEGMIMPGEVTTSLGRISLHGMIMTGLQGRMQDNTGLDDDEDWTLMPWDPVWQENGAKISLTYENGRYGAYFMIAAEDWAGTIEEGMNNVYMPYAYLWRSFFDSKLKVSFGKLYDVNYQTRERIWKAEGASNGGWSFSDSNHYVSTRLEFKPIPGLNVGAQWDFLPFGQSALTTGLPELTESIKEVGVAAEYQNDMFTILGGVRFDGADGINKYDTYSYLKDYYGEWGYVGNGLQNEDLIGQQLGQWRAFPIHWKYQDEIYGEVSGTFSTANADKPFDGSTRVIFGFNFKGVKNLTAKMQASFWNLGDFDRFGTGSIDETLGYTITPKFSVGANFFQEFYGKDAFPDNMINSPYFRFNPYVSYQLTPNIGAGLSFTYGIAKDVVESDWSLRPGLTFILGGFGSFRAELYYELNAITYTDEAVASGKSNYIAKMMQKEGGKATYTHNICLSVMWMF
jgi:hypothetical protein